MSAKIMAQAWEHSPSSGSELLVLLALADSADARGWCSPSISGVAHKARISERQAQRMIRALEQSGQLTVTTNHGRGHTNEYMIVIGDTDDTFTLVDEPSPPVEPVKPAPPKQSKGAEARFDQWYATYPRKVGKVVAKAAFLRHASKVPLDTLIAAVEQQKQSEQWTKDGGKFIPNPATWLNQGRWEDELPKSNGQANLPVNMRVNNDRDLSDEEWLGSFAKRGTG